MFGEEKAEQEISLFELWDIIWSRKMIIILLGLIFAISGILGSYIYKASVLSISVVYEMTFEGIEESRYPDGRTFNKNDILGANIVAKSLESLRIPDVSVDSIINSAQVEPIVPQDILTITEQKLKESEIYSYVPNRFILSISPGDSGLSKDETRLLLEEIIAQYNKSFHLKYSENGLVTSIIKDISLEKYDYPDMSNILTNQVNLLLNYINAKSAEAPGFRSLVTGYSFSDIANTASVIKNVDIDLMNSIINTTNLTKDKELLILKYEYLIEQNELNIKKLKEEAAITENTMTQFEQGKTNTLLIPGLTSNLELEPQNNNAYYERLAERSTDSGVNAASLRYDNEYILKRIEALKNDIVSSSEKKQASERVMLLAGQITEQLSFWLDITDETIKDYYDSSLMPAAKLLSVPQADSSVSTTKIALVCLFAGLFAGCLFVLFQYGYRRYRA